MKRPHWADAGRHTLAALGVLPLAGDPGRATISDPATGVALSISGVDAGEATCPACAARSGDAAFVAVIEDLRLLFACPSCRRVTWLPGA